MSDDAVAPVVATILMVSIAVVLAGVVLIMTSLFHEDSEQPEVFGARAEEQNDRLLVARAPVDLDWGGYEIRSTASGVRYAINEAPTSSSTLVTSEYRPLPSGAVIGGEFLAVCSDTPQAGVEIQIRHQASNALVLAPEFATVAACA